MRRVFLNIAAISAVLTLSGRPAAAEQRIATGIPNAKIAGQPQPLIVGSTHHHLRDRDEHFRRGNDAAADAIWGGYELQSSYDDRDWRSNSGNDWWHDRPDRAFPRWVQHNEDCTPDRMWWSGSGWHC